MKRTIWPIALVTLIAAGGLGVVAWRTLRPADAPAPALVGGPFQLVDQTGHAVDEHILRGRWTVVFFGYTYCPDVCPTTLTALGQTMAALKNKAARLGVVFITVDPERDTPAQLSRYLASPSFPRGVIGLTGSPTQIAAAAKAFRVYFRKVPDGASYSMDHTAVVYLMDPNGRFSRPLDISVSPEAVAQQVSTAMNGA